MILERWRTQQARRRRAEALYRAVVSQTRQPEFYVNGGIEDTFEGRFDLLVLHAALVLYRLKGEGAECKALGQKVFDLFFADMDAALREMGVGDTTVPKRIREMSEAFYGRLEAYDAGLRAAEDAPLRNAVARNLYGGRSAHSASRSAAMVRYMRAAAEQMRELELEELERAALFPEIPDFSASDQDPAREVS